MKSLIFRFVVLASLSAMATNAAGLASGRPLMDTGADQLGNVDGDGGVSPFYNWRRSLVGAGRMLREETLPADLPQPNAAKAERILYSSSSGVGRGPIAVSGMIFFPNGAPPVGGWPIMAWAHGTTGFADVCAPSWTGASLRDRAYLQKWLDSGFAVVASDYEGLGTRGVHPYLLWRSEGRSVLDAVRAARDRYPTELANQTVIVGQSQGAGAALGATYLWKSYAPKLNVLGTVATGLVMTFDGPHPADFVSKSDTLTDPHHMDLGFAMLRIAGIDRALHPELDPARFVLPQGRPLLRQARTGCLHDLFAMSARQKLDGQKLFVADLAPIDGRMSAAFDFPDGHMPVPLFAGTGLADDEAGTQGQYNAVKAMCAAGTALQWHTYPGEDHSSTVMASTRDSIPFALSLVAGRKPASNCTTIAPPGPLQKHLSSAST